VQNFSMRKIHPKRETTFWRKNRQLDHVQNSGMFCSKFIIIILFIPSFFSWKNTTCLSILILTLNTALNTREENIWKILKRRKMQTRENFWGEIIFLTKRKGKNRVFVFKIQYSVSAIFPHLAVPVLPTKWIYWALSLIFCFFIRDWNLECDCFSFLLI